MKKLKIAILGGTGFVGHHLCAHLANLGHEMTVFTRHPERHNDLTVLPTLSLREIDIYNINSVLTHIQGFDALINLVGILNESGHHGEGFERAHVTVTKHAITACLSNHIPRLIQMSALNATDKNGSSFYLMSKGIAEQMVLASQCNDLNVTTFRPSVIYGPGDSFLTKFAKLLRLSPGMMLLPSAGAIVSPIYVEDVVKAMGNALQNRETFGQAYDLCGPKAYTLKELVEYTARIIGKKRWIIGLNNQASSVVARIFEYLPFKPYSVDNYLSALTPSVCKTPFPVVFNTQPASLETIVPQYLGACHLNDRYSALRDQYSKSK